MSNIDVSNVKVREEYVDSVTGELVIIDDGVETRYAQPNVVEELANRSRVKAQLASRVNKAKAILDDPVNAPDWSAVERKVILAAALLSMHIDPANK